MESAGAARDGPAPARADDAPKQPASSAQGRAQAKEESRRRKSRPPIDLDDTIAAARAAAKAAATALAHARQEARTERKRRARLVRKASQLSSEDLERIAVLKRTGFWDPSIGDALQPGGEDGRIAGSGSGGAAAGNGTATASAGCSGGGSGSAGNASMAPNPAAAVAGVMAAAAPRGHEDGEHRHEGRSEKGCRAPQPPTSPAPEEDQILG